MDASGATAVGAPVGRQSHADSAATAIPSAAAQDQAPGGGEGVEEMGGSPRERRPLRRFAKLVGME